jgi:hypothetical protein
MTSAAAHWPASAAMWLAKASARLPVTWRNITLLWWRLHRPLLLTHLWLVHLWLWLLMRLPKASIALWFAHVWLVMVTKTISLMRRAAVWCTVLLTERAAAYPVNGSGMRSAMVSRSKLAPVMAGHGLMRYLLVGGSKVALVHRDPFLRTRACMYTAGTVKTGAVVGYVADNRAIDIRIVYYGAVYINHRRIVAEMAAKPGSAYKTYAYIAKTVVNAAVISNVWPPVTRMKAVKTGIKTPVTGCP